MQSCTHNAFLQVSATNGNYEDPYTTTCGSGEINATIENIAGAFCTPSCSVFMPCPSPTGFESFVDAQCMLQVRRGSFSLFFSFFFLFLFFSFFSLLSFLSFTFFLSLSHFRPSFRLYSLSLFSRPRAASPTAPSCVARDLREPRVDQTRRARPGPRACSSARTTRESGG